MWDHSTYPHFLFSVHFFLQLLSQEEFASVEKIKIIGSTYMAACGLSPGRKGSSDEGFLDDESDDENQDDDHLANPTTMAKGPSIFDVHKLFEFLNPPPHCLHLVLIYSTVQPG